MIDIAVIYSRKNSKRLRNKDFKKIYKQESLIKRVIEDTQKWGAGYFNGGFVFTIIFMIFTILKFYRKQYD